MTISLLAPRASLGGALPHRSTARLASSGVFAQLANDQLGLRLRKLVLFALAGFFGSFRLIAATATLAWDANPEADIAGYLLSYGDSSGNYSATVDAGNKTTMEIADLIHAKTYYFVVSAYNRAGTKSLPSTEISYTVGADSYNKDVSKEGLSVHYVDSEDPDGYSATFAIDGDPDTFWHTTWRTNPSPPPHELQVDLGSDTSINGFRYLPRSDGRDGNIGQYQFYVSDNGNDWGAPVASGSFSNTKDLKTVTFSQKSGRYVRLRALTDANGGNYTNIAELTLIQEFQIPRDAENTAPTAIDQDLATTENTSIDINLTGIDSEGNPLSYLLVTSPEKGRLTGIAPNLTYIPTENFSGTDRFSFRVNDGSLDSGLASIAISVNPIDRIPTAFSGSVTTLEENAVAVLLAGSDPEGSTLTYTLVASPEHGYLSGKAPKLTYTPAANFNGKDLVSFTVSDGNQSSEIATIDISVTAVNDLPVALAAAFSTAKNTATAISLSGSDADADILTYTVVSKPTHGILSGSGQALTYTPKKNFSGSDSFTFLVNDGAANSVASTVSFTITPTNAAPVAFAQSITTSEDSALPVALSASDADEDSLKYTLVAVPEHGSLRGTAPNLTYTPSADYNGSDRFSFFVNDGELDSEVVTVSITVSSLNDRPTALRSSVTTLEDTAITVLLAGSDPENSTLTYTLVASPEQGSLSGTASNLTYTPAANFHGKDLISFTVSDGDQSSEIATIEISVIAVNDLPVALAAAFTTAKNTTAAISLSGSDADADTLTYTIASKPTNGILSGSGQNLTYTPKKNFSGSDSFAFLVNDGAANSVASTVSFTITPTNAAPVAFAQSITTAEDSALPVALSASDADEDALKYTIVASPEHGSLSGKAPNLTYTPAANFHGKDLISFTVSDGDQSSEIATIEISVIAENDLPVALAAAFTTAKNTAAAISLSGSDADADTLTYTIASKPANGILSGSGQKLTYTPKKNFSGSDSFTFVVNDGAADSGAATVSLTITPTNAAPVAFAQSITTAEDSALPVALSASDADEDSLKYTIITGPEHGSLSGTAPNLTYTPSADYNGSDRFSFLVNDGELDSDVVTVSVTVNRVNDSPNANSLILATPEDTPIPLVLSGDDRDSDKLSFIIVNLPSNGTLNGNTRNLTYQPGSNFSGSDQFTFRVNDGPLSSQTATVFITITPVNDAPAATAKFLTTSENKTLAVTLEATDPEGDDLTYSIVTGPKNGTLSGKSPNLVYIPTNKFSGNDSFSFKANDGNLDSATTTVSVTINQGITEETVNPRIFVNPLMTLQANENEAIAPQKLAILPEVGTGFTFTKTAGPAWLKVSADGTLTGTPKSSDIGKNIFTVSVSDLLDLSDEAQLTVTVLPLPVAVAEVNQAPAFISNPITMADAYENASYTGQTLAGHAVDANTNDSLRFWKIRGPAWLNIALSGKLSGTPPVGSSGVNHFAIGVADSSSAVAFSELKISVGGVPLPWSSSNVGTGQMEGSASYRSGTFTQAGSGLMGNTNDKLRFTFQTLSGDGEIIAKVDLISSGGSSSLVGVMIRDSLSPQAKHVFVGIANDKSFRVTSRAENGKKTAVKGIASTGAPGTWVRLVRNAENQEIYSFQSADGVNWTLLGSTKIKMPTDCHVGLAVSSGNNSTLDTSTFNNVYVAP